MRKTEKQGLCQPFFANPCLQMRHIPGALIHGEARADWKNILKIRRIGCEATTVAGHADSGATRSGQDVMFLACYP
jgi:hypothetical protein